MYAVLAAAIFLLAVALCTIQLASDAIFARAGVPQSLPAHLDPALGARLYAAIARVAPAPYVRAMLYRAAFDRGDLRAAHRYAVDLPPSAKRDDELASVAQARGDEAIALEEYLRAADVFAIARQVDALQRSDPAAAFALEARLKERLQQDATHPDALAESYWRLGTLAIAERRDALALREFARAVQLSPLSLKYLLYAGFEAYDVGQTVRAKRYFDRAIGADPTSADAFAGAGLTVLRLGDRAAARDDERRARIRDPHSSALHLLQAALQ